MKTHSNSEIKQNLLIIKKRNDMKTLKVNSMMNMTRYMMIMFLLTFTIALVNAQNNQKPSMAILNIYAQNMPYTPEQLGNLVRLEVEKLDTFQVWDTFDVKYVVEKNKLDISTAYGKIALTEIGQNIKADKMLTGSVELFGSTIIVTMRLIDVKTASIERTYVKEFLNVPDEIQTIVHVAISQMFNRYVDNVLLTSITQKSSYDSEINNPNVTKLNLSGPRMGFSTMTGGDGKLLRSKADGGFQSYPVLFVFGYQFEKQYLNSGSYQALFEFIPLFTLINDKRMVPSFSLMNGLRSTKNGWEFACGLTFTFNKKAEGYYDNNGEWQLAREWVGDSLTPEIPFKVTERLDSRGSTFMVSGFIVAVGKTFKSGKLNIPVNAFISPGVNGCKFGVSFGFNAKKNAK